MSREIDERIVQMKFEKGNFEKNIQTSIHSLEELKKGMNFKDAVKGFDNLDKSAKAVKMTSLGDAVDAVRVKFTLLDRMAINVMDRISNAAINTGKKLVESLTIDQLTPGWQKYENKTSSVQTIMAATAKQFSNTAEQMDVVNAQLDKLNWFTDETSYNFVDMVNNIGKFTSNNIGLEESVTAMQGIATWAAKSGANAGEASRAMYNLAQALATGSVKLIDWKSIENANMATTEFKQTVIDVAQAEGTLIKVSDDLWTTLDKKVQVSVSNFNEGLSKGWFTKDVLMKSLNRYGAATNKLNEITEKYGMTASSLIKDIDRYTAVLNKARNESKELGLTEEETQKKIREETHETVKEISEDWGNNVGFDEALTALNEFDSELMQFGLKAFKAAQEAKTFTEAIDSVKDAVSTGWMKSFEIIFGDYMQAKEFWTNIANTLYDIFAASGDARNEMLADWAEANGREYFIDTIYASLAAILSILAPIKAAWKLTFGEMNGELLANLTLKLRNFVQGLILNEEAMVKLIRTFRGLFSIVDMVKTTISRLAKGALSVLERVLNELNIDIGSFTANAGDFLYALSQWYKESNFLQKAFDGIGDAIIFAIRAIKQFIASIGDFGPVKKALEVLQNVFGTSFEGIVGILVAVGKTFYWLWNRLLEFRLPTSFADVKQFFVDFAKATREAFSSIGIDLTWFIDLLDDVKTNTSQTAGVLEGAFGRVKQMISDAVGFLQLLTKDVDWAGVLIAGMGVVTLAILWKLTDALKGFATALGNVTKVGETAQGAFKSIKGYFDALTKNIKTNNILKTAIAIAALAGAVALLAQLKWKQVLTGAGAILALAGAVAIVTAAMNKFGAGSEAGKAFTTILSLAAAIAMLAAALKMLPMGEDVWDRVGVISTMIAAFGAVVFAISRWGKSIEKGAAMMMGLATSVWILILALKSIGEQDLPGIYKATPVLIALMGALGTMATLLNVTKSVEKKSKGLITRTKSGGSFGNIMALCIGLNLLIIAIKSLGKSDPAIVAQGIILMIPIMTAITGLALAINTAGKHAKEAGKMILYIAAALLIIPKAIKDIAALDMKTIAKGGAVITALGQLFFKPLIKASEKAGQYGAKAGILMLAVSASLMLIQLVIKTLGRVDTFTLIKGTASVGAVILALSEVVKSINEKGKASADSIKVMQKLLIMIGLLGGVLIALSILNPEGALIASAGISMVLYSLGKYFAKLDSLKLPNEKKVLKLTAIVAIIGGVIGLMGTFTDWKGALATATGMSMVLLSVAAMTRIMKNSATSPALEKKIQALIPVVAEVGLLIGALSMAAYSASKNGASVREILYITTGMSEIMIAMGAFMQLLKNVRTPDKKLGKTVAVYSTIMTAVMAGLGTLLYAANKLHIDLTQLTYITKSMAMVIVAMGSAIKIMDNVKIPSNIGKIAKSISGMIAVIGVVFGALGAIVKWKNIDPETIISLAGGLSIMMIALGAMFRIMGNANPKTSIEQASALSIVIGAIGIALGLLAAFVDPSAVLPIALGLSPVLIACATAAVILGHFPKGAVEGALEGLAIITAIMVVMGLIMTTLGAIDFMLNGDLSDFLDRAVTMIQDIGRAIGGFVGGIVGGLGEGVMRSFPGICDSFSEGMKNLQPFFEMLQDIPGGAVGLAGTFVAVIGALTVTEFIAGLKKLPGIGSLLKAGSETLEDDFKQFGKALRKFSTEVEDLDADKIKTAADAVVALGGLEASMGGINNALNAIFGSGDLGEFGNRLKALGKGLRKFSEEVKDLDTKSIETARRSALTLVALEQNLPSSDGWLQTILGTKDLNEFGRRLEKFGEGLVGFADEVKDLNVEAIETARLASIKLVDLENSLSSGGLLDGIFFGTQDLSKFGERLVSFGNALVDFDAAVDGEILISNFENAVTAATYLSDLEKTLDPTGGVGAFWSGDSSLNQFGTNIKQFGVSLQSFSSTLTSVNFERIESAVSYVERMLEFEGLDEASAELNGMAKQLIDGVLDFIDTFEKKYNLKGKQTVLWLIKGMATGVSTYSNLAESTLKVFFTDILDPFEASIKASGAQSAMWMIKGFVSGLNDNKHLAITASKLLASRVVEAFNAALEINSPSLVMAESGMWIVKGLAEGITKEDSAEEAAVKKAKNIVSAFDSELSKLTLGEKTVDLEFQLWQLTDGKNASESEIAQKQLEIEGQKLANLAKNVGARKAALDAIEKISGKDSDEYQSAYQTYLQAQIDMITKQKEIDTSMGNTYADERDKMKAIADYMKENAAAYEMLGKSMEDLEADAQAKFGGINDKLDTAQIIAENIDFNPVDIEKSIAQATADAVKNGAKGGSSAAAAAGTNIGETLTNAMQEAIENSGPEAVENGTNLMFALLGGKAELWNAGLNEIKSLMKKHGVEMDLSLSNGVKEGGQQVLNAIGSVIKGELDAFDISLPWFKQKGTDKMAEYNKGAMDEYTSSDIVNNTKDSAIINKLDEDGVQIANKGADHTLAYYATMVRTAEDNSSQAAKLPQEAAKAIEREQSTDDGGVSIFSKPGKDAADGYAGGILSGIGNVVNAAATMVKSALFKTKEVQDSNSPAKETMDLGNDFGDGYVIGIEKKTPDVVKAASAMGDAASEALNKTGGEKAGEKAAKSFTTGFSNAISSSGGGGGGGGNSGMSIAMQDSINKMLGKSTSKEVDKIINDIGYNVSKGIASGMISGKDAVRDATNKIGNSITSTLSNNLQVKSPSRITMEIGNFVGLGLAKGIDNAIPYVSEASEEMANNTISSLDYAAHAIDEIINSENDFRPVITPVIDLDQVEKGASDIGKMFSKGRAIDLTSAKLQVGRINADRSELESQNGSKEAPITQNYNYTQNNYSPKALNRVEIYRQTSNQFARLKGATKV